MLKSCPAAYTLYIHDIQYPVKKDIWVSKYSEMTIHLCVPHLINNDELLLNGVLIMEDMLMMFGWCVAFLYTILPLIILMEKIIADIAKLGPNKKHLA